MKNIALLIDSSYELLKSELIKLDVKLDEVDLNSEIKTQNYDAFVIALEDNSDSKLKPLIQQFHEDSSPIGAFKNSPRLVSEVLGDYGVAVTMGNDSSLAEQIEKSGAQFVECEDDDFITDRQNKVVTSPVNVNEAGIQKAIAEIFEMA